MQTNIMGHPNMMGQTNIMGQPSIMGQAYALGDPTTTAIHPSADQALVQPQLVQAQYSQPTGPTNPPLQTLTTIPPTTSSSHVSLPQMVGNTFRPTFTPTIQQHHHQQQQQQPPHQQHLFHSSSLPSNPGQGMIPAFNSSILTPSMAIAVSALSHTQLSSNAPLTTIPNLPTPLDTNPENIASNWSTHTAPSGVYYYYNSVTQSSTYSRPACLPPLQGLNTTTTATTATVSTAVSTSTPAVASQKEKKSKWTEHVDPSTGKKYYYDGTTTTWEKPKDYMEIPESNTTTNTTSGKKRSGVDGDPEDVSLEGKRKKKTENSESLYTNKAEAITAFKGLLLAKGVTPTMKWNDVVKLCSGDTRWETCPVTMGERKQALAEYKAKRANELNEEKRLEKIRCKDAFIALLTETMPSMTNSTSDRFVDVRSTLMKDDRFFAVEEESEREEIFYEFQEESRKREDRQRRNRKKDVRDSFWAFLKTHEEMGSLTFATTWSSFTAGLDESNRSDSRFMVSSYMSDSDRQVYFADYVLQLQNEEDEKKRRIRDARRRAEKAQRDAYRDLLRSLATTGKITPLTEWRQAEDMVMGHESFGPLQAQDRNAPRELFQDFVRVWYENYRRDASFISHLCASSEPRLCLTDEMQYEDFVTALLDKAGRSELCSEVERVISHDELIPSAKIFFDEMKIKFALRNQLGILDKSITNDAEVIEDGEVKEGD
jgi:pre-mRNA-processing factor 40